MTTPTSPLTSAVLRLGELSLDFARVNRATYHPDGSTPESDTDHTVMLGLVACAFAHANPQLRLDLGLVAQYALVHDLVEVYAGDTPTLRPLTEAEAAAKGFREHEAWARIVGEFYKTLPWVPETMQAYAADFPPIFELRAELIELVLGQYTAAVVEHG